MLVPTRPFEVVAMLAAVQPDHRPIGCEQLPAVHCVQAVARELPSADVGHANRRAGAAERHAVVHGKSRIAPNWRWPAAIALAPAAVLVAVLVATLVVTAAAEGRSDVAICNSADVVGRGLLRCHLH